MLHRLVTLLVVTTACADRVPIEDGATLGPVVQLQDWFTSVFVVPTEDGAVLFDAGFRAGAVERGLEDQGIALDQITDVFLTHGHSDHLAIASELPDARIRGLEAERALVEEESGGAVTLTDPVEDGDELELGGRAVEVFAVPGHTSGSAVYLVAGVLILGDSAIVDRDGNLVPVADRRSDEPDTLVASMQELAERLAPRSDSIDWLAPAHSAPIEGFEALARFPER